MPPRDGGDRELIHDPAPRGASHVNRAVDVGPLLQDHPRQRVADEYSIAAVARRHMELFRALISRP